MKHMIGTIHSRYRRSVWCFSRLAPFLLRRGRR